MPKKGKWSYRRKLAGKFESMRKGTQSEVPHISPDYNRIIAAASSPNEKKRKENYASVRKELTALSMGERPKRLYAPKPKDTGNRVVHWESLKKLVCDNTSCKSCGSAINLTETTVGIAT